MQAVSKVIAEEHFIDLKYINFERNNIWCCSVAALIPVLFYHYPDGKVHGAYMGPTWGRQDPDGPHVGPIILAIWVSLLSSYPIS